MPVRFISTVSVSALMLALGLILGSSVSAETVSPNQTQPTGLGKVLTNPLSTSASDNIHIKINIPSRTLWVYEGDRIIRYFPVGVGRVGFPTPLGRFSIIRKVEDPGWENPYMASGKMRLSPGANNPLGTRWMGFLRDPGGEYGMHGTDNPASVGKLSSHGCVRLRVSDAEALFELVDVGTPVEVVYQPVIIRRHADEVKIAVYGDPFRKGMPSLDKVKQDIQQQFPNAKVNEEKLKAALRTPQEKYILVGSIEPESSPEESVGKLPLGQPYSP